MIANIIIGIVFFTAFFPAYLWYQPEHAWIGYIFTIGFALCSYIPFLQDHKYRGIKILWALILFWYVIESIWVLSCFPYGCFNYSDQLGIKIFNIVPLMLAFTWPPLVLWVWSYTKNRIWRWWKRRLVGWVGLVIVDLILDPIAVMIWLRSFPWGWFWFGVPLSNFLWWMLSGTIAMIIIDLIMSKKEHTKKYTYWLWMILSFFVWYLIRYLILHNL